MPLRLLFARLLFCSSSHLGCLPSLHPQYCASLFLPSITANGPGVATVAIKLSSALACAISTCVASPPPLAISSFGMDANERCFGNRTRWDHTTRIRQRKKQHVNKRILSSDHNNMRFRSLGFVCLRLSSSVILTCLDALAINPTFLTCMFQLSSKILVILMTMFTHAVVLTFNIFSMAFDFLTERSRGFAHSASYFGCSFKSFNKFRCFKMCYSCSCTLYLTPLWGPLPLVFRFASLIHHQIRHWFGNFEDMLRSRDQETKRHIRLANGVSSRCRCCLAHHLFFSSAHGRTLTFRDVADRGADKSMLICVCRCHESRNPKAATRCQCLWNPTHKHCNIVWPTIPANSAKTTDVITEWHSVMPPRGVAN